MTIRTRERDGAAVVSDRRAPVRMRHRRVWRRVAVVVVVLIVLAVAAELAGRALAASYVSERLAPRLGISAMHDVSVSAEGGSILLQAVGRSADGLVVSAGRATWGGLSGSLRLEASGVSILGSKSVGTLRGEFSLPDSADSSINGYLEGDFATVDLDGANMVVTGSVPTADGDLAFSEKLTASAVAGELWLTPVSVEVGGVSMTVPELAASPYAPVLMGYTQVHNYCVNEQLPVGIGLDDADVRDSQLVLSVSGADVHLDSGVRGTCG